MITKRDLTVTDVPTRARRGASRVVIVTLTTTAIAATLPGCSGTGTVAPTSPPPASPPPAATPVHHARGVTGQLTAINDSTWTVHTTHGQDVTVTLTPQTQFGTKKTPAIAQQFTAGNTVRVIGKRDNNTITATRVTTAHPTNSTSPSTEPPPPPPPPPQADLSYPHPTWTPTRHPRQCPPHSESTSPALIGTPIPAAGALTGGGARRKRTRGDLRQGSLRARLWIARRSCAR